MPDSTIHPRKFKTSCVGFVHTFSGPLAVLVAESRAIVRGGKPLRYLCMSSDLRDAVSRVFRSLRAPGRMDDAYVLGADDEYVGRGPTVLSAFSAFSVETGHSTDEEDPLSRVDIWNSSSKCWIDIAFFGPRFLRVIKRAMEEQGAPGSPIDSVVSGHAVHAFRCMGMASGLYRISESGHLVVTENAEVKS